MTFEELMQKVARVAEVLDGAFEDVVIIADEIVPGRPIPIALTVDGIELVAEVTTL